MDELHRTTGFVSAAGPRLLAAVILLTGLLGLVSCSQKQVGKTAGSITVAVSIEPQAFFAAQIGGDIVAVDVMVPPAQSPATYEPTPKQMAALEKADVYFRIGVPFENRFIGKIESIIGKSKVVDVRQGITMRWMDEHGHDGDTAAGGHEGIADPHTWLDPMLVKIQARTMTTALEKIAPADREMFETNLERFDTELDSVDQVVAGLLAPYKGQAIYVYHPSYGYFTDRYGLRQVSVETDGKEPSAKRLAALIDQAKRDHVTTLFVQPQFAREPVQAIADALGADVVELDPLSGDYLNNLTAMARRISLALAVRNQQGQ